jgi:hypothetical protein
MGSRTAAIDSRAWLLSGASARATSSCPLEDDERLAFLREELLHARRELVAKLRHAGRRFLQLDRGALCENIESVHARPPCRTARRLRPSRRTPRSGRPLEIACAGPSDAVHAAAPESRDPPKLHPDHRDCVTAEMKTSNTGQQVLPGVMPSACLSLMRGSTSRQNGRRSNKSFVIAIPKLRRRPRSGNGCGVARDRRRLRLRRAGWHTIPVGVLVGPHNTYRSAAWCREHGRKGVGTHADGK